MAGKKRSRSKPVPGVTSPADEEDIKPIIPKHVLNMAGNAPQPGLCKPVSGVAFPTYQEKKPCINPYHVLNMAGNAPQPSLYKPVSGVTFPAYQEQKPWINPTPVLNMHMAGNAPQPSLYKPLSGFTSAAYQEQKPWINPTPVLKTAGIVPQPSLSKPVVSEVTPPADPFINLQIYYQRDGSRTSYRVKRNAKLQKLLVQYCIDRSLDMNALRILFEGTRLRLELSPQELKMEDGGEIEVMIYASGGSKMV